MSWEAWGDPPDPLCEVCGATPDHCVCPECPVCGVAGDPACYPGHGLERSEEQIASASRNDPDNDPYDPAEWER
jgi:hypothetical protein